MQDMPPYRRIGGAKKFISSRCGWAIPAAISAVRTVIDWVATTGSGQVPWMSRFSTGCSPLIVKAVKIVQVRTVHA